MSWKVFCNASNYSGIEKKGKASSYSDYLMRDNECVGIYKNENVITDKNEIEKEKNLSKEKWKEHLKSEKVANARLQKRIVIAIPNDMTQNQKIELANKLRFTIEHKKSNIETDKLKQQQKEIKKQANKINMQIKRGKDKLSQSQISEKELQKKELNLKSRELAKQIKNSENNQESRNEKREILNDIVEHRGVKDGKENRHFHIVLSDRNFKTKEKDREFQDKKFLKDLKNDITKTLEKYNYKVIENEKEFQRERLPKNEYEEFQNELKVENELLEKYETKIENLIEDKIDEIESKNRIIEMKKEWENEQDLERNEALNELVEDYEKTNKGENIKNRIIEQQQKRERERQKQIQKER